MPLSNRGNGNEEDFIGCPELAEEQLVDYVMNRLNEADRKRVAEHAALCSHCRERMQEWELIMQIPGLSEYRLPLQNDTRESFDCEMPELSGITGNKAYWDSTDDAYEMSGSSYGHSSHLPPAGLKRKLRLFYLLRSFKIRMIQKRRFVLFAAGAAAFAGCLLASLFSIKQQAVPYSSSLEQEVTSKIALIQTANYDQYPISPLPPLHGSGGVWINRDSGEMLIVVDGLTPPGEKDYQVWLQHEQQLISAGMLLTRNLSGKGYYFGHGMIDPDQIVISLEPKGGSMVQTGPEALRVIVNGR